MKNFITASEKRVLVGRRYEDYLRNGIYIELTPEESLWMMAYNDPRYGVILDRRKMSRRQSEPDEQDQHIIFHNASSLLVFSFITEER
ncbi:MAG: hypothetical protein ACE5GL_12095 [Calditrichia bacterium]